MSWRRKAEDAVPAPERLVEQRVGAGDVGTDVDQVLAVAVCAASSSRSDRESSFAPWW